MNISEVSVGQKIRQIRETVGLSRPKFAELLGVPPTTLKNYELGYREVGGAFLVALGWRRYPGICEESGCRGQNSTGNTPAGERKDRAGSPSGLPECPLL